MPKGLHFVLSAPLYSIDNIGGSGLREQGCVGSVKRVPTQPRRSNPAVLKEAGDLTRSSPDRTKKEDRGEVAQEM
jgi:hypothetical protein